MNEIDKQILHEWFNNDVTISYLVDKYLPNMRKEVILLIRDNLENEHLFKISQEDKKKAKQERKKAIKEQMQKGQSIPIRNRAKGKRQTNHMIEQTIYMPHELKAILEEEFNTGGWNSMSEIVRSGISHYFAWLEKNVDLFDIDSP
jgi:hypothetical protein